MAADLNQPQKEHSPGSAANHVETRYPSAYDVEGQAKPTSASPLGIGNPSPLGLFSFATGITSIPCGFGHFSLIPRILTFIDVGIFLIATVNLHARDIATPNLIIGVLLFFGGTGQFLSGIMEFVRGNTLGATLWCSYSAFNLSYSMIYIPGTGIMSSYTGANSNDINPEFYQALAMYCWAWFIIYVLYTVAAIRSNWVLFLDLVVLDLAFLLLAVGYMTQSDEILKAGFSVLLVTAFLSCNILPPFLYLVIRSSR